LRNLSCLSLLVKYFHLCLRDISLKNPCEENGFFKVCYYIYEWCLDNVIFVWLHLWMMSGQCHFCLITFMNDVCSMSFLLDCVRYYIYEWYLDNVIFVWLCSLLHLWMISGQCHICLIVFVITFMNDIWTMSFLFDCVRYYIYEWYLDNVIFVWLCSLLHLWMISGQCHVCLIVFVIAFMNDVGCTI
jgi:hypothetical protein